MAYDEYEDSDDGTEQMFWVVGCEYEVSWGFPSLAYGGRQVEGGEEGQTVLELRAGPEAFTTPLGELCAGETFELLECRIADATVSERQRKKKTVPRDAACLPA